MQQATDANIFARNSFLLDKRVSVENVMNIANTYDIRAPETRELLATCTQKQGVLVELLRLWLHRNFLPSCTEIRDAKGALLFTLKRSPFLFVAEMFVYDENDRLLFRFRRKFFSFLGRFTIFDGEGARIGELQHMSNWPLAYRLFLGDQNHQEIAQIKPDLGLSVKKDAQTVVENTVALLARDFLSVLSINAPFDKDPENVRMALTAFIATQLLFYTDSQRPISDMLNI